MKRPKQLKTQLNIMANICNNTLEFSGEDENMKAVYALFLELKKYNEEKQKGAMPDFLALKDGYFFDLYVQDDYSIGYWTKWVPNELVVKDIADKYKVDFVLSYEELGCGLFGKFIYDHETQVLQNICLTDEDMDMVTCNNDGIYLYKGEEIECPEDVYNELLDNKITAINSLVSKYEADSLEHIFATILVSKEIGAPLAEEIIKDLEDNNLLASFESWGEMVRDVKITESTQTITETLLDACEIALRELREFSNDQDSEAIRVLRIAIDKASEQQKTVDTNNNITKLFLEDLECYFSDLDEQGIAEICPHWVAMKTIFLKEK